MAAVWGTSDYPPSTAFSVGEQLYELVMTGWGTAATDQFPASGLPGLNIPLAGIAIGPRSTVDRAYVTWNRQKAFPTVDIIPKQRAATFVRRVSLSAPLLFSQSTNDGPPPPTPPGPPLPAFVKAMRVGQLFIFPQCEAVTPLALPGQLVVESTLLPQTYVDASGNTLPFGTNVLVPSSVFLPPLLHLYLIFDPKFQPPQIHRAPLVVRGTVPVTVAAGENCVAQIPVFGRKCINIQMSVDQAATLRVGALRGMNADVPVLETTEGLFTAVPANTSKHFQLGGPGADYLMLYATPNVDGNVSYTVVAED